MFFFFLFFPSFKKMTIKTAKKFRLKISLVCFRILQFSQCFGLPCFTVSFGMFIDLIVLLLCRYILSIEKAEEIEEYVGDLLQGTDGRKKQFIDELLSRWMRSKRQSSDTSSLFLLKESASPG